MQKNLTTGSVFKNIITFRIQYEGVVTSYQAEDGMTFYQWINSQYNTDSNIQVPSGWEQGAIYYIENGDIKRIPKNFNSETI